LEESEKQKDRTQESGPFLLGNVESLVVKKEEKKRIVYTSSTLKELLVVNEEQKDIVYQSDALKELKEKFNLTLLPVSVEPCANSEPVSIPSMVTLEVQGHVEKQTLKMQEEEIKDSEEIGGQVEEETYKIEPVADTAPVLLDTMVTQEDIKFEETGSQPALDIIEDIDNEGDDDEDDFFVGNIDDKASTPERVREAINHMSTGISIKESLAASPLHILKPHPVRSHEQYLDDIHGTPLNPSIFTVIPGSTNNLSFLIKIGPSGYWFRPRISTKFMKSEDPEFPYVMRVACCSQPGFKIHGAGF